MTQRTATHRAGRFLADGLIGLALFLLIAGAVGGDYDARADVRLMSDVPTQATVTVVDVGDPEGSPRDVLGDVLALASPALRLERQQTALAMLALAFSALFALNLGFWRHLRRAYAIRR